MADRNEPAGHAEPAASVSAVPQAHVGRSREAGNAPRFSIGRVGISAVTMEDALRLLHTQVRKRAPAYVCVGNVRTTVLAQKDTDFCKIQNESFLTLPDGMPLVWYARLVGVTGVDRVTGPDLMLAALRLSKERGYSHYFYGDTSETLSRVREEMNVAYPDAVVKGYESPPFGPLKEPDMRAAAEEINRLNPDFVWVALGAPKQERWMARVLPLIDRSILIGVGAAFRFLIGEYKHPPGILQKCGLEGVCWRFLRHPLREGGWYAHHIPAFGWLMLKGWLGRVGGAN